MILILSEKNDLSTNQVIDWLNFLKKQWLRINENDVLTFEFEKSIPHLIHKEIPYALDSISSIWYRRSFIKFTLNYNPTDFEELNNLIKEEFHWYSDFLIHLLKSKKSIGSQDSIFINKLKSIEIAKQFGIETPTFIITTKKKDLYNNKKYITKTVAGNGHVNFTENIIGSSYTTIIDYETLDENFSLSFFQEYIEKKFEIRVFFFNNMFYSMAIFSQSDNKTVIDFRNYNKEKPNRFIPYKLPSKIIQKLKLLIVIFPIKKLHISCFL